MTKFINLSAHASVRLKPNAPHVEGTNPKTGRAIKVVDLNGFDSVADYVSAYTVEVLAGNDNSVYTNPVVKQVEAGTFDEVLEDGTVITHNVGGKTVVEGLPNPVEGVVFITSYVVAQAAQRADVVSPNTVADPATGFAVGAIGYIAFG